MRLNLEEPILVSVALSTTYTGMNRKLMVTCNKEFIPFSTIAQKARSKLAVEMTLLELKRSLKRYVYKNLVHSLISDNLFKPINLQANYPKVLEALLMLLVQTLISN